MENGNCCFATIANGAKIVITLSKQKKEENNKKKNEEVISTK